MKEKKVVVLDETNLNRSVLPLNLLHSRVLEISFSAVGFSPYLSCVCAEKPPPLMRWFLWLILTEGVLV